jgi:hypothetical protein
MWAHLASYSKVKGLILGFKMAGAFSIAQIKNEWSCTSTATIYLQDMDRDNNTFTFNLAHFLSTSR